MQLILRHITDVSNVDFDWTSSLRFSPPRPQDSPEYVASDLTITISSGAKLKSSLIIVSPKSKDEAQPLDSISWLNLGSTEYSGEYSAFANFRRALMHEANRQGAKSSVYGLQAVFDNALLVPDFEAHLARFYASTFWNQVMSRPQLIKLPELGWSILFQGAIWQALPGITSGMALTFLTHLSSRCGTDVSRELLKKLVDEPINHEMFMVRLQTNDRGSTRTRLSEAVRHEVWRRDQGKCASCGSSQKLEFDHIVPHSRGGSDTVRNIQLLCEPCNRRKSDTI
jgi:hypothetical protein